MGDCFILFLLEAFTSHGHPAAWKYPWPIPTHQMSGCWSVLAVWLRGAEYASCPVTLGLHGCCLNGKPVYRRYPLEHLAEFQSGKLVRPFLPFLGGLGCLRARNQVYQHILSWDASHNMRNVTTRSLGVLQCVLVLFSAFVSIMLFSD